MKGGIFLTRERKNSKYGHFIKLTFEDENEFDEYISTLENLKTTYKTDLEFLELVEILDHIIDTMKKNKNTKAVYDAFFSGDGFVVIRDSDTVYWIRSLKDPNVWMKLEED